MNTFLAVLITAAVGSTPIQYLTNAKSADFTYVCFIQDECLKLIKIDKEYSYQKKDIVDTGISTKGFENVTMEIREGRLVMEVCYKLSEKKDCVEAVFNSRTLDLEEIQALEKDLLAIQDIIH